jgi:Gas vesicle protein G
MGLISMVLTLPAAPVRGVVALAEVIQDRVNQELYDPASVRQELEAAEEARQLGEISPEEEAEVQQAVVERMTQPAEPDDAEER